MEANTGGCHLGSGFRFLNIRRTVSLELAIPTSTHSSTKLCKRLTLSFVGISQYIIIGQNGSTFLLYHDSSMFTRCSYVHKMFWWIDVHKMLRLLQDLPSSRLTNFPRKSITCWLWFIFHLHNTRKVDCDLICGGSLLSRFLSFQPELSEDSHKQLVNVVVDSWESERINIPKQWLGEEWF